MAMVGELFSGFENIKSLVEKLSESLEKNTDTSHQMVYTFIYLFVLFIWRIFVD